MVARTRRRLLNAVRALRDSNAQPPGVVDPEVLLRARSGAFHTSPETDWRQAYETNLSAAVRVPVGA